MLLLSFAVATELPSLLCAGSAGLVFGLGTGLGLGYLAFGYPWRNSGGVWVGNGGAGFWLPKGRRKRSNERMETSNDNQLS